MKLNNDYTRMGTTSTPSGSPWNRSRVILNIRPAVRAQIRLISDKNLDLEKVWVPHWECRNRRAEGPRRPVASMTKGMIDLAGITAVLETLE